jgi:uncharacterized protein
MLKEKIEKELIDALKNKDQVKRSVLGMLKSAIKNKELIKRERLSKEISDSAELEKQSLLTEEEVVEVIMSEGKKRRESIEQFSAAGRNELAENETAELEVLKEYLPEQLSEEDIRTEVEQSIKETKASEMKDMGKVISHVMSKIKGKADGSTVSKIVKELLAS